MDANVSSRCARLVGGRRGFLPYAVATVQALRESTPEQVNVAVDGRLRHQGPLALVTVANTSQYGYGLTIAPGARPDDGCLDLCLVEELGLVTVLRYGLRLLNGSIDSMPGVSMARGRSVEIRRPSAGALQTDGEVQDGGAVLNAVAVEGAVRLAVARET